MNNKKIDMLWQMIKFGLVGLTNTTITFVVYSLGIMVGLPFALANFFGYAIAMINSYFWNSKYVFAKAQTKENGIKFIVVNVLMYLLSTAFLTLFINYWGIDKYLAQIISLLVTLIVNFLLTKFWTFK